MAKTLKKRSTLPRKIREGEIKLEDLSPEEQEKVRNNLYKTTRASRKNKDGVKFGSLGAPNSAQRKLIERYKANNPDKLVKNTIAKLIDAELPNIKKAIESLEKYSDINVYEVLPKELDSFIRDYDLIITDYYYKSKGELGNKTVVVIPEGYIRCGKCGKYKSINDFFTSTSDVGGGYMMVCKDCANKMLKHYYSETKDIREALILFSQKMDLYIHTPTLNKYVKRFETLEGKEEYKNNEFLGLYLHDIQIDIKADNITDKNLCFSNTHLGGVPFKNVRQLEYVEPIYHEKVVDSEEGIDEDEEMTEYRYKKLRRKWGVEDKADLKFLENSYKELEEQYDLTGLNSQMLVKQLCFEELNLSRIRKTEGNADKALKAFRDLMSDLNLTPKKEKATTTGNFESLGSLIQAAEKEKPFINVNPAFEDVDGIKRMRDSMIGAKDRTLQRETEFVKKFEENYAEYSVDLDEEFFDG